MTTETQPATKTVGGYFGKTKQITREDFIKRWASHYSEFYHLANTNAEYDELIAFGKRLTVLAGNAWDRIPEEE